MTNALLISFTIAVSVMNITFTYAESTSSSKTELISYLKKLETGISPTDFRECSENLDVTKIGNCSERRPIVLGDIALTSVKLNRLKKQVRSYYSRRDVKGYTDRTFMLDKILKVVQCMQSELGSGRLSLGCAACVGKPKRRAYVSTNLEIFIPRHIYLCPEYFKGTPAYRAGTLVHELSHFCGTDDWNYLFEKRLPHTAPSHKTSDTTVDLFGKTITLFRVQKTSGNSNADNYQYWTEYGFCLPNLDCKKP